MNTSWSAILGKPSSSTHDLDLNTMDAPMVVSHYGLFDNDEDIPMAIMSPAFAFEPVPDMFASIQSLGANGPQHDFSSRYHHVQNDSGHAHNKPPAMTESLSSLLHNQERPSASSLSVSHMIETQQLPVFNLFDDDIALMSPQELNSPVEEEQQRHIARMLPETVKSENISMPAVYPSQHQQDAQEVLPMNRKQKQKQRSTRNSSSSRLVEALEPTIKVPAKKKRSSASANKACTELSFPVGTSSVSVAVRGARKTQWMLLTGMPELHALPYKWALKIVFTFASFRDAYLNLSEDDLELCLYCIDVSKNRQIARVQDGITIEKFRNCTDLHDGLQREYLYQVFFNAFSHSFDKSPFFLCVQNKHTGERLYTSSEFMLFARRDRTPYKRKRNTASKTSNHDQNEAKSKKRKKNTKTKRTKSKNEYETEEDDDEENE